MFGYIGKCFKLYVRFAGRARRKEYWSFALFYFMILIVSYALFIPVRMGVSNIYVLLPISFLFSILDFGVFLPLLAVTIRRLHDSDRHWAWIFVCFIPLVGFIWFLVLMCKRGTVGENRYGADPKVITDTTVLSN